MTETSGAESGDALAALARGLLQIADAGGMPDAFWRHDSRVGMAREILGVPEDGRQTHAHLWAPPEPESSWPAFEDADLRMPPEALS
jgi:hypothetical protein